MKRFFTLLLEFRFHFKREIQGYSLNGFSYGLELKIVLLIV